MRYSIALLATVVAVGQLQAHSGRTDSNGGHYDRRTGTYHYHNSGTSSSRPRVSARPSTKARSSVRFRFSGRPSTTQPRAAIDQSKLGNSVTDRGRPADVAPTSVVMFPDLKYRTWTSANGRFKTIARMIRYDADRVTLEKWESGKKVIVPTNKLSESDKTYIRAALTKTSR